MVAIYSYLDHDRQLLFQVVKRRPKRFVQRRPDGNGSWIYNLDGVKPNLYRLPELRAAGSDSTIWIPEGEKDVENLCERGLVATCNPGGARQWREEYSEDLRGRHVCILPDNDDEGRKHAVQVARSLHGVATSVKVLELPSLPHKGDVTNWLEAGGTADKLMALVEAAPEWGPEPEAGRSHGSHGPADTPSRKWPDPLSPEAFHGLAGQVVRAIEPHTEADPVALLVNFLVHFGNAVGRNPHGVAEADRHGTTLYGVNVGDTSKGRKGSGHGHIRELFRRADPDWSGNCVKAGLSSGEGLTWVVRDPVEKIELVKERGRHTGEYEQIIVDAGVSDKRLLLVEQEFAAVLKVMSREGNILSTQLRQAWDTGDLRTLTKNNPAVATGAHISVLGHITKAELLRYLSDTEAANGFGNRFLWVCTKRSKVLPEGGGTPDYNKLVQPLHDALERAKGLGRLFRDDEAREAWAAIYPELSEGKPGLFGAVTARAEAQVLRLSVIYATLEGADTIQLPHLMAALAVWEYCEASARYIFGDATGDPIADRILESLQFGELTRTQISNLLQRNASAARIAQALNLLLTTKRASFERRDTEGKSVEVWMAV